MLAALIAEALARPNGAVMRQAREQILPRVIASVGGWLTAQIQAGRCTDLPLSLLIPLLISPISVHLLARTHLVAAGQPVPDRQRVIDAMTDAFCHAVGTSPP